MPLTNLGSGPYATGAKSTAAYGHSGAFGKPLILQRAVAEQWGIPEDSCVTYTGPDDLEKRLLDGVADGVERAQRYRTFIEQKVFENHLFLQELARSHTAFEALRR